MHTIMFQLNLMPPVPVRLVVCVTSHSLQNRHRRAQWNLDSSSKLVSPSLFIHVCVCVYMWTHAAFSECFHHVLLGPLRRFNKGRGDAGETICHLCLKACWSPPKSRQNDSSVPALHRGGCQWLAWLPACLWWGKGTTYPGNESISHAL